MNSTRRGCASVLAPCSNPPNDQPYALPCQRICANTLRAAQPPTVRFAHTNSRRPRPYRLTPFACGHTRSHATMFTGRIGQPLRAGRMYVCGVGVWINTQRRHSHLTVDTSTLAGQLLANFSTVGSRSLSMSCAPRAYSEKWMSAFSGRSLSEVTARVAPAPHHLPSAPAPSAPSAGPTLDWNAGKEQQRCPRRACLRDGDGLGFWPLMAPPSARPSVPPPLPDALPPAPSPLPRRRRITSRSPGSTL